jgi:hypothetical protein
MILPFRFPPNSLFILCVVEINVDVVLMALYFCFYVEILRCRLEAFHCDFVYRVPICSCCKWYQSRLQCWWDMENKTVKKRT